MNSDLLKKEVEFENLRPNGRNFGGSLLRPDTDLSSVNIPISPGTNSHMAEKKRVGAHGVRDSVATGTWVYHLKI